MTRCPSDDRFIFLSRLFFIDPEDRVQMALPNYRLTGNRSAQPVYVEDATSAYKQKTLSSISAVYGTDAPPSIIISLRAGVFARAGSFSRTYFQLSKCSSCPAGMTSSDGAMHRSATAGPTRTTTTLRASARTCGPLAGRTSLYRGCTPQRRTLSAVPAQSAHWASTGIPARTPASKQSSGTPQRRPCACPATRAALAAT